jgi:hypothetical protein
MTTGPDSGVGDPIPLTDVERDPWHPLDLAVARVEIAMKAVSWGQVAPVGVDVVNTLPAAAGASLERGADGEQLLILAGMAGASWSELQDRMRRVYAERDVTRPTGDHAWVLTANALLREIAESTNDPHVASAAIYGLGTYGPNFLTDALGATTKYWDQISLVDDGTVHGTPAAVRAEFRAKCAAILRAGGVPGP